MDKKMQVIWELIEKEKIKVRHDNIRQTKEGLIGVYIFRQDAGPLILLDSSLLLDARLHNCTLAHELGHYFTGAKTNFLYASTGYATEIERSRDERRAMMWSTNQLMPTAEVYSSIRRYGIKTPQELAEYFEVTASFCMTKLTFIKQELYKHNIRVRGRGVLNTDIWPLSMRKK